MREVVVENGLEGVGEAMTEQHRPGDEIEHRIADYFAREAAEAPVSANLWQRVRARRASAAASPRFLQRLWSAPVLGFATTIAVVAIAVGVWAVAIDGDGIDASEGSFAGSRGPAGSPGVVSAAASTPVPGAPTPTPAPSFTTTDAGSNSVAFGIRTDSLLPAPTFIDQQTAGRSIVSTATVGIEVEAVRPAMDRLRSVVEGLGGFVEQLSTSGGPEPRQGNATLRVPGSESFAALEGVKALGTVLSEQVGSDDVTNDLIDLEARLRGEQAKEASFIELLERANSVSDVLSVERELSRVRTEIEQLEGQLSFIERRVDLATIHVSLSIPADAVAEAPSASLSVQSKDVNGRLGEARTIVTQAGGEVQSTTVSQRLDGLQATLVLVVPPSRFDDVVRGLERLGSVLNKELFQAGGEIDTSVEEEAEARIVLTLSTPEQSGRNWWLWAGIPAGGVAGVVAFGLLLYGAYRAGRRET